MPKPSAGGCSDPENQSSRWGSDPRRRRSGLDQLGNAGLYGLGTLLDEAGKILLKGQSIGNGGSFDFSQTGIISKDAAGNYSLTIEGTQIVYTKCPRRREYRYGGSDAAVEGAAAEGAAATAAESAATQPAAAATPERRQLLHRSSLRGSAKQPAD